MNYDPIKDYHDKEDLAEWTGESYKRAQREKSNAYWAVIGLIIVGVFLFIMR